MPTNHQSIGKPFNKRHLLSSSGTLVAVVTIGMLTPGTAQAQVITPPGTRALDKNGVDLITNQVFSPIPAISTAGISREGVGVNAPFDDNFLGSMLRNGTYIVGNYRTEPVGYDGSSTALQGTISTLTMRDGTLVSYDSNSTSDGWQLIPAKSAIMTQMVKPDGEILKFYYKVMDQPHQATLISGTNYEYHNVKQYQIQTVTSSLGWMVKYELEVRPVLQANAYWPKKIYIVNTAVDYCDFAADTCTSSNSTLWPTLNIATGKTYSDASGASYGTFEMTGYTLPSGAKKTYGFMGKVQDVTIGSSKWTYTYNWNDISANPPYIVTVTAPDGSSYSATSNGAEVVWSGAVSNQANESNIGVYGIASNISAVNLSQIASFKDELSRVTKYTYVQDNSNSKPIYQVISPEATYSGTTLTGGYTQYAYDGRRNITSVSVYPKGGGSPLVTAYEYETSCTTANYKYCNQAKKITDPKGNVTDYTYDTTGGHGGVVTETRPADSNGVRPQTRYFYTQLTPQIKNASGTLVNSTPVWRLTKTSTCRSSTNACAGTADETVTTYAYNTANLLQTSVTVAAGDGSITATTTNTYDLVGNVTSVDGPRTDVDDRTYTTYNVRRQPLFEIGVDPDGSGSLKRKVVKHVWDTDNREYRTESGTGNATDGSDFVAASYVLRSYNASTGLLVKTVTGTMP